MIAVSEANNSNWRARLELEFSKREDNTVLSRNYHFGPLLVQKPFYPEGKEICHSYIIHPPGGVVQGDQLHLDVQIKSQAKALITTPAATKFYRCNNQHSTMMQSIQIENHATLEWLPQETLLFDQSLVELSTIVRLEKNARFIGWEILCLGRKASAEQYQTGKCRQSFELWREKKPLYIERSHLEGGKDIMQQSWGMNNKAVTATMLITHCNKKILTSVQQIIDSLSVLDQLSVSLKEDLLICRFLGEQSEKARQAFTRIWAIIRPQVMGYDVHIPRIWNT